METCMLQMSLCVRWRTGSEFILSNSLHSVNPHTMAPHQKKAVIMIEAYSTQTDSATKATASSIPTSTKTANGNPYCIRNYLFAAAVAARSRDSARMMTGFRTR